MSILIKGMEMPQAGAFVEVLIWSDGHVTQTGDSYFAEDGRAYYQPCDWKYYSAVDVPTPHGRLIDADELRRKMFHEAFETDTDMQMWDSGCWIRYKMFERVLKFAPTIIEAEGE